MGIKYSLNIIFTAISMSLISEHLLFYVCVVFLKALQDKVFILIAVCFVNRLTVYGVTTNPVFPDTCLCKLIQWCFWNRIGTLFISVFSCSKVVVRESLALRCSNTLVIDHWVEQCKLFQTSQSMFVSKLLNHVTLGTITQHMGEMKE